MDNQQRVVVVTGSSSGIGRAIAIAFAKLGDMVVVHGFKNQTGLEQTIQAILSSSEQKQTTGLIADISSSTDCKRLVDAAFAWKGHVDVWVNAAGVDVLTGAASKFDFEDKLDLLWRTDVAGTIRISRLVADRLIQQPQKPSLPLILNLSWDQAEQGMEGDSGQFFAATKAAIAAFSKSLAKSVGPRVRVNCIAPGWIQTDWGASAPALWDQRARSESILGRWGTPEDVAHVAVALSNRSCSFINGQTICVNGGWKPSNSPSIPPQT